MNQFLQSLAPKKLAIGGQSTPTTLIANNPSAVTPTSTTQIPTLAPKPANTPAPSSPAKSSYVNSLVTTPAKPIVSPSTGLSADQSAELARIKASVANPQNSPNGTTATGSTDTSSPTYLDSYKKYLTDYTNSLAPTDEEKATQTKLNDIEDTIDSKTLASRKAFQDTLDQTGGVGTSFAGKSATIGDRHNSYELANYGVAENSASRALAALTGARTSSSEGLKSLLDLSKPLQVGDTYIDPTTGQVIKQPAKDKAGFALSPGESRYEYNAKTGQYEKIASVAPKATGTDAGVGTGGYTPGANPTVDSWANRIQNGSAKITDIPASQVSLRNAVSVALDAMGNSTDGKPTTTELGKAALTTANSLLSKFESGKGTAAVGGSRFFGGALYSNIPGTDSANFVNDFNALKSQLSLEGVKYLKGQGQVSDSERALLAQATSKLNLSQSEAEFKDTLNSIIDKLKGGGSTDTSGDDEYNAYLKAINK